ncbi:hypothetical protein Y032_0221g2539 [Ancylostoma ceylanicum]|uniref:Uncharacterized protein n=1 Tax=Ancylostoma ceylanicum TaxID=53326 RepID=A0A016SI36_9BILA|nr:hypothetical protein Y032_0221g2539 [Ancylostoma ceylanicum]
MSEIEIDGDFAYSSVISTEHISVLLETCLAELVCNRGDAKPLSNVFVANVVVASNSGHPAQHLHFPDA